MPLRVQCIRPRRTSGLLGRRNYKRYARLVCSAGRHRSSTGDNIPWNVVFGLRCPLYTGRPHLPLGERLDIPTGLARMLRIVVRLSEPVHAVSPRCQRSSLFRARYMAGHSWLPLDERVYPGRIIPRLHRVPLPHWVTSEPHGRRQNG